jgi:hypothetical protein
MRSLEDVFKQEFKQRTSNVGTKNIYSVPLPPECSAWKVSGTELYLVKGISSDEVPYCDLNDTVVRRLPQGTVAKRRVIDKASRGFKLDADGKYVYEKYSVPTGSVVVISSDNIGVLYKGYKTATKTGYGYVDFIDTPDGREYMYVLPKSVLYGINQTALALSVKNMKNYSGYGYITFDYGTIYLHVIPYSPRAQYVGSKILATKCTLDFRYEVESILKFWQSNCVIPELQLCCLEDGSNIALRPTEVGYTDYVQVQPLALGDKEIYGSTGGSNDGDLGKSG